MPVLPRPRLTPLRLVLLALLGWFAGLWALDRLFPLPLPDLASDRATVVVDRHGEPLRAFPDERGVWRYPVSPAEVSPAYIEALIGYEDRRFHYHGGVDPLALLRAAGQWLWHGKVVSGGSTLSMQVARIIDPHPRSLTGKLRQMARAVQLEWHLGKEGILALYLNYAPFGGTLEGVEAASFGYLGKPSSRLSDAEAALLAVLPQAPSRLRPDRHPRRAQQARDKLLQRLQDLGDWPAQRVAAARQEAVVARRLVPPMLAPLAAERLRRQFPRSARIDATLDAELQRRVEAQLAAWIRRYPEGTSAAALVVRSDTLEALAYVGTAAFGDATRAGHVDMLRAWRSPGSTLKPFIYGLALDEGLIHSASLLVDAPQDFDGYRPGNFDQRFRGPVDAAQALRLSLNIPAVALLDRLGPAPWAARLGHAGVRLRLPRGTAPHLGMALGASEVRLDQLVGLYAALHADGIARRLRLSGAQAPEPGRRLLSPGAAWIVRRMLERSEDDAWFDRGGRPDLAAKTGTSYGFRDAWAIGATPAVTIGVWVGRPDGTPLPGQFGAVSALPLLHRLVDGLPRDWRRAALPRPDSVEDDVICWPLGRRVRDTDPAHCHRRLEALILEQTVPPSFAPKGEAQPPRIESVRIDSVSGRRLSALCRGVHQSALHPVARWPALALPWLDAETRRRSLPPPLSPDCLEDSPPLEALVILGIDAGSRLRSPPGNPNAPKASVRASGATGNVRWLLNGRLAGESASSEPLTLSLDHPGPQILTALDATQRYGQVEFVVE
ncbi:penicillin-binding protein 1C [Pseudomarimonas salicorniae]|uniref:peptidoglycan glycosyltransferase n=1 Tax=Pseudomarimonas salicorniae TaxID=2933270 RepID=A0ABT0GI32_9GAMM|nr:penicillin-binding protein 1C [Lysobacter sp. CAU 1642]MCK7594190.1 penicillin-binding protein 1C [Lysobacter sp. CAU 1642]